MTISSSTRKAGPFSGTGTTGPFSFAFKVFVAADLHVVKLNSSTGIESVLALTTDYTVSLNADQNAHPGGTVTLTSVLSTGYTLTLTSELDYTQETDLTNQGGFYPRVITDSLDKLTILTQQLNDGIARSVKTSVTTPDGVSTQLPIPAPYQLIGWDRTGAALQNYDKASLVTISGYGTAQADTFAGDGTTTVFVLSFDPANINNLDVSVGGVTQVPGVDYTWTSGTLVTFTTAPPSSTTILIRYMLALPQGSIDWGSVSAKPFISSTVYINSTMSASALYSAINVTTGGSFVIAPGATFTIDVPFTAPLAQVFSGSGSVVFSTGSVTEVYPEWWGSTYGATNTTAFQKAVASGCKKVVLSDDVYTVAPNTNANGCILYGAPTVLINYVKNASERHSISVTSDSVYGKVVNPEFFSTHRDIVTDNTVKCLERVSEHLYWVYQKKQNGAYALLEYINNFTTTGDSLATTTADVTRFRLGKVYHVLGVYGAVIVPTATSGSWSTLICQSVTGDEITGLPLSKSGEGRPLTGFNSSENGAYKEYSAYPYNGKINIAFIASSASCEAITISVDGVSKATVDMKRTTKQLQIVEIANVYSTADDGKVTVRVTNGTTGNCNIVGINYFELQDWTGVVDSNITIGYLRNTNNFVSYLGTSSANDNVIREYTSYKYGLSYHGGESSISTTFYVDNSATTIATNGKYVIGKSIVFDQSCVATWDDATINVRSVDYFGNGGTTREFQCSGEITVAEIYAAMFGCPESFSSIVFPDYHDLTNDTTYPNTSRIPVGYTNAITLENPTTKQRISVDFSLFSQDENRYGSVHVWKVEGSYHKIYYTPIQTGQRTYTQFGCRQTQRFW